MKELLQIVQEAFEDAFDPMPQEEIDAIKAKQQHDIQVMLDKYAPLLELIKKVAPGRIATFNRTTEMNEWYSPENLKANIEYMTKEVSRIKMRKQWSPEVLYDVFNHTVKNGTTILARVITNAIDLNGDGWTIYHSMAVLQDAVDVKQNAEELKKLIPKPQQMSGII